MAKPNKVAPAKIDIPVFDSSVTDGDNVLVNRGNTDYHTSVDDLTQFIGKELEIDKLVEEINKAVEGSDTDIDQLEEDVKQGFKDVVKDQTRQNGWTGTPESGENGGKTFKELIDDNAAAIASLFS